MKILLSIVLLIISFVGCSDPSETKVIHTVLTIEKSHIRVVNYEELFLELDKKDIARTERSFSDKNTSYFLFDIKTDSYVGVISTLQLKCGAKGYADYYQNTTFSDTSNLSECIMVVISKQELDKHNCLQAGGQTRDLTGSLYGYAEYVEGRVTPVEHTVTSNTITYTAQEINEAFAVFNE